MLCPAMDGIQCIDPGCSARCRNLPPLLPGAAHVVDLPPGEQCVSMCVFREQVLVATTGGVYKLIDDRLVRIPFEVPGG